MSKRRQAIQKVEEKPMEIVEDEEEVEEEEEEEEEELKLVPEGPPPKKDTITSNKQPPQKKRKQEKEQEEQDDDDEEEEEEEEEEDDAEKEEARIEKLKAGAQELWIGFLKDCKDAKGETLAKSLFTSVPKEAVTVQVEEKNKEKFVNGKYWADYPQKKKLYSFTKWLPPMTVKYQWTGAHGNFNPESKYNNTYDLARYTLTLSEKLPADFVEWLDRDWINEDPKTRNPVPPHEIWQNAIIGTFEHIMDQQNALLGAMYDVMTQVFSEEKINKLRADAEEFAQNQIKSVPALKRVKRGSLPYKEMVETFMRQFFMAGAKRFVSKVEDKGMGQYELRAKRRVFFSMSKEEKEKQKKDMEIMRAMDPKFLAEKGIHLDNPPEEVKPRLQGFKIKPLKIVDCNRDPVVLPKSITIPSIVNGSMVMAKLYMMPFNNGDSYGISGQISSYSDEEIVLWRPGQPGEFGSSEPRPEFPGGVVPTITYEAAPKDVNPFTDWIKSLSGGNDGNSYPALPSSPSSSTGGPIITHAD